MKITVRARLITLAAFGLLFLLGRPIGRMDAKEKIPAISSDDPTLRLYQVLDTAYGGKLDELYLIADVFKDPKQSDHEEQHILRVEYDKNRGFGKLRIYIRTVDKLTPAQLKAYTPKQAYDFAEVDSEKFTKTDAGSLGRPGDIYFHPATDGGPLATAPVTDGARTAYERYIIDYILPALQKK